MEAIIRVCRMDEATEFYENGVNTAIQIAGSMPGWMHVADTYEAVLAQIAAQSDDLGENWKP